MLLFCQKRGKKSKHYPSPQKPRITSLTRKYTKIPIFSEVFDFLWCKSGRRKQKWGFWGISEGFAFISLYNYDILKIFIKLCFLYVTSSQDFLIHQKILWIGLLFLHDWNFQEDFCIAAILSWHITMFLAAQLLTYECCNSCYVKMMFGLVMCQEPFFSVCWMHFSFFISEAWIFCLR